MCIYSQNLFLNQINNILLIKVPAICDRKGANVNRLPRTTVYCTVPLLKVVKKIIHLCFSMSLTFSSGSLLTVLQQTQSFCDILFRILKLPLNFFLRQIRSKEPETYRPLFSHSFPSFAPFSN